MKLDQINYWNAGGPAYRWNEIARALTTQRLGRDNAPNSRALALMNVAIYDAMIAAWDSKYLYNRQRPGEFAPQLSTVLANPKSPSYPSEYAVAAGAASAVLIYLLPGDEGFLNQQAEAAAVPLAGGRFNEAFSLVLMSEQRFYFLAQNFVTRAGLSEEGVPMLLLALQSRVINPLNLWPTFRRHEKSVSDECEVKR